MYEYFYKKEIEAFSFLKIPMILLEDENFKILTSDAKILYSIMLQRASLSYKNKWIDEKERVYIYFTLQEVQETLNKAKEKACKIIKELEDINLIEKKRQGLGKPNLIYVKNFMKGYDKKTEKQNLRSQKNEPLKFENRTPVSSKNIPQEVRKSNCSYIDNNKIDISKIDFNKKVYGSYQNVYLTENEYLELKEKISYLDELIERLSSFMKSNGRTYKDHKATLLSWYLKEKPKPKEK